MMKVIECLIGVLLIFALGFMNSPLAYAKGKPEGNPPGFAKGEKKGFEEGVPHGWTQGKKKGWEGNKLPPGLQKKQGEEVDEAKEAEEAASE
ncbi:MAG: hypothetical protein HYZ85_04870 [Candidatus Omnitrophica bacterium]|nr:hypothetical protein [Candidatus Omnitrophota bacterium]